jgi:hypothetical protein
MDPYENLLEDNPYKSGYKRPVTGELVVALDVSYDNRGLQLIAPLSRAVPTGDIHELILTDESDPRKDETVDSGAVIGFIEIQQGGVVAVGDGFILGDRRFGTVVGFDESHAPNHQNIVISTDDCRSGVAMDLDLGISVRFERDD